MISENESHNHAGETSEHTSRNLGITFLLNLLITVVEIVGGLAANSLSLLSDALHNFSDASAVAISYVSIKIGEKDRDPEKTFGYKRAEIIAAVINSTVLLIIAVYLFKRAYVKFMNPEPIRGGVMFAVALVGLAANSFAVFLLHSDAEHSLNIQTAYLHLLADAFSSVAVIGGGAVIYFLEVFWLDPLITVVIAIFVAYEAFGILGEAVNIVMQGTPPDIEPGEIIERLEQVDEVKNLHHTHLWSLSREDVFLETHVKIADMAVSDTEQLTKKIEKILREEFGVSHLTVQYEARECEEESLL